VNRSSSVRWSEAVLALCAALALWQVVSGRGRVRALETAIQQVRASEQSLARRLGATSRAASSFRNAAAFSRLDSTVHLVGLTRGGQPFDMRLSAVKGLTLLYSFDFRCSSCLAHLPFLNGIAAEAACPLKVIGVLASGPEALPKRDSLILGFDVVHSPRGNAASALPLTSPSSAVLLGKGGRVLGLWVPLGQIAEQDGVRATVREYCDAVDD
jgi:hypothetical protein